MEELAESVKEEFQCRFDDLDSDTPFWEYSASFVDDNLDMIFDNFDRLSDYLEAEEIDYLMHSVKLPGLVYSQRVSEFMKEKYNEIVEEVQDVADDSIYDSLGNKVSFVSLVSLPNKSKKHLPEFPTSCLPEEVRDYIEAVSESLQVPIDMVASIVLTIVPQNFGFMIAHPSACTAPVKLNDFNVHHNTPLSSGDVVTGRVVYDAFVLDNKKDGIYYHAIA